MNQNGKLDDLLSSGALSIFQLLEPRAGDLVSLTGSVRARKEFGFVRPQFRGRAADKISRGSTRTGTLASAFHSG